MARKKETHVLKAVAQQAAAEVEAAKNAEELVPTAQEERFDLTPREISFSLSYDGPDGKDYDAELKSRIMDSDGRLAKARVIAQLTRGLNPDLLGQEDRFRVEALGRISIQLIDPPTWVYDFTGQDLELLAHINRVLMEHETRYFRGNARQGESGEIKARVRSNIPAFAKSED